METFDEKQAQAKVLLLKKLRIEAAKGADAARGVLRAIDPAANDLMKKLNVAADGKLADGVWNALPAPDKFEAQQQIQGMVDALAAAIAGVDEPREPESFMFRTHASNAWVFTLVVGSILVLAYIIVLIHHNWDRATSPQASEKDVLRMVIMMGGLGGGLHWISSLANYIGNGNLYRRWIPYYVLAPFQGAALAMLVYLLLRVGVLAPSPAGGSVNLGQTLNVLGLYAFSGLTGLFAKQAIEMLRDVFGVIFKKIEGKDASGGIRPPAAGASKPPDGNAK